jgi:hypothetical protein
LGPDTAFIANGTIHIAVFKGSDPAKPPKTIDLNLWGDSPPAKGTPLSDLLGSVRAAMSASTEPLLAGATATIIGGVLRICPGPSDASIYYRIQNAAEDNTATQLGLAGDKVVVNVARYQLGQMDMGFQVLLKTGADGDKPSATDLRGVELEKTSFYALEKVDLFNLLVMPDPGASTDKDLPGSIDVISDAITYCTRRRAFMIIDAPENFTLAQAQTWLDSPSAATLRSRNAAVYFPRIREPDPLRNNAPRTSPAAGALAGIFARTDANRGVWKAPAGTETNLVGVTGLAVTLTDKENGTLNPLGLNCLRTFPVYGSVSWGARTSRGADALADDYKYIPVRRLALFLEESLYRGTQWAVFEPNDEPLWAQIRLNLGAFMHTLFAQGAFKGKTPREAYFVKCDGETTTQNDVDLGRVNIAVGFAPLKPAEFIVIQIQQIAGNILT